MAPILKENCFACHGAKKHASGKLDMTTSYAKLRQGGTNDDPIVPGKPDDSQLIDAADAHRRQAACRPRISGETKQELSALPPAKIKIIKQWIEEGAKLDAGLKPEADLLRELRIRWQPPPPPAPRSSRSSSLRWLSRRTIRSWSSAGITN